MAVTRPLNGSGKRPAIGRAPLVSFLLIAVGVIVGCSDSSTSTTARQGDADQTVPYEPVVQLAHTAAVGDFRFTPDGRWLLTADRSHRVIQWNAETGDLVRSFSATAFEIAPDGQAALILASEGNAVVPTIVSLETGEVLQRVHADIDGIAITRASLTRDGRYILLVGGQAVWGFDMAGMALWDMRERRIAWDPQMSLPYGAAADVWESDFIQGGPWIINGLREDRKAVLFRREIRPDGQVLATQSLLSGNRVSPDGKQMLTRDWTDTGSSTDDTILWDLETAEPLARFSEPYDVDEPFRYGPDNAWFVRGIYHKTAALCDATTGEQIREFAGHTEPINALDLSPDKQTLITVAQDGTAILWDVKTGAPLRTIEAISPEGVESVVFSPTGEKFLIGTAENSAILYDNQSGQEIRVIKPEGSGHAKLRADFSPDGQRIITLAEDGYSLKTIATLWNAETGARIRDLTLPPLVRPMTISPDGEWALVWRGSGGMKLALWHLPTAREVHRFDQHLCAPKSDFWDATQEEFITPSGAHLHGWSYQSRSSLHAMRIAFANDLNEKFNEIEGLTPAAEGWLRGFMLKTSRNWPVKTGPNIQSVISTDGRYGATWSEGEYGKDRVIKIQEIETDSVLQQIPIPANRPTSVAFSPDGEQLVAAYMSPSRHAVATMWDVATGEAEWHAENLLGKEHVELRELVFSPQGRYVALSTDWQRDVVVLDSVSGEKLFETDGKVTFSSDGELAFFRGDSDTLWNVPAGTLVRDFGPHDPTHTIVFSPNGRFVWYATHQDSAIYSAETGEIVEQIGMPMTTLSGRGFFYDGARFGRDGNRFISRRWHNSDVEQNPSLWDLDSGKRVCELQLADGGNVYNATFSPDGRKLIAVVSDRLPEDHEERQLRVRTSIVVWDAKTGNQLVTAKAGHGWTTTPVWKLLFIDEGESCLTIHSDAAILWDVASGMPLQSFREPGPSTLEAIVAPDEKSLLTISPGCGATVWDMTTGERLQNFPKYRDANGDLSAGIWTADTHFTEDGQHLVIRSHQGRGLHLMNIETGQRLWSFFLLGDGREAVTILPDGRSIETSPDLIRDRQHGTNVVMPRAPSDANGVEKEAI